MAQVVHHLPSKYKALSATIKKKKKKEKEKNLRPNVTQELMALTG
jgi:hypothetical protein